MASQYQKKPKVFIMGLSSFMGYHLARCLRHNYTVVGCYFHNPVHIKDVHAFPVNLKNDTEMLERLVSIQSPDFAISAVGMSDPKLILDNPKVAENINITLPLSFALMSIRARAKFILLSTAEVFDGKAGNYEENNRDFSTVGYGKMKATAEAYIRAQTLEGTILRFGKVIGLGHPYRLNFLDELRAKLQSEKPFYADENKIQSYLSISSFTKAVEVVLQSSFPANRQRVLHFGGPSCNEMEMAQVLAAASGLNPKFLKPVPRTELSQDTNISLDCTATTSSLEWQPESREELINHILQELKPGISHSSGHLRPAQKTALNKRSPARKPPPSV